MSRSDDGVPDIGSVPDDVVDLLTPGDHAPHGPTGTTRRCPVGWRDVQDVLGGGPPWQCGRPADHGGQHVAFAHSGAHVAAVLPAAG